MNAKELYEAYDGRDVILNITQGELTEREVMSIRIVRPRDCLKFVEVYLFRLEDDILMMYADSQKVLYNVLMNPAFEEEE